MNWHFLRLLGINTCKLGLHHFSHWTNREWEKKCDHCGREMIVDMISLDWEWKD